MSEQLIIVSLVNGTADPTIVHLPDEFVGDSPYRATAKCGVSGIVYRRGGSFANAPICDDCMTPQPQCDPSIVGSLIARYSDGCRCAACRKAMSAYRRDYQRAGKKKRTPAKSAFCVDCGEPKSPFGVRCRPCCDKARARKCGTDSRYRNGCRCDDCKRAHAAYQREWARRRAAA